MNVDDGTELDSARGEDELCLDYDDSPGQSIDVI